MPPTHQRFKDFKVLRISFGLGLCKLSELSALSALSVPGSLDPYIAGSLAPWLPGCLAPYWIYGSLVPGRPDPREAGKDHAGTSGSQDLAPRSRPRIWVLAEPDDPGPGGSFPLVFKGNEVFNGGGQTLRGFFGGPVPPYKAKALNL